MNDKKDKIIDPLLNIPVKEIENEPIENLKNLSGLSLYIKYFIHWVKGSQMLENEKGELLISSLSGKIYLIDQKNKTIIQIFSKSIINIPDTKTPATSGAVGTKGDICWDANYIYVCTASNPSTATYVWKRTPISVW